MSSTTRRTTWTSVAGWCNCGPPAAHTADVGDEQLLADVRDYLQLLRDETWRRRDSAMSEQTIVEEISALMIERHPEWEGRDWIEKGVRCVCSERLTAAGEPS